MGPWPFRRAYVARAGVPRTSDTLVGDRRSLVAVGGRARLGLSGAGIGGRIVRLAGLGWGRDRLDGCAGVDDEGPARLAAGASGFGAGVGQGGPQLGPESVAD